MIASSPSAVMARNRLTVFARNSQGTPPVDRTSRCPVPGRPLPRGARANRRFCSSACRVRAWDTANRPEDVPRIPDIELSQRHPGFQWRCEAYMARRLARRSSATAAPCSPSIRSSRQSRRSKGGERVRRQAWLKTAHPFAPQAAVARCLPTTIRTPALEASGCSGAYSTLLRRGSPRKEGRIR